MQLVDTLARWGVFQLALGGGEPLLRQDISQICAHAQRQGLVVHVTTGCYDVCDELFRDMAESISVLQIGVKHQRLLEDPRIEYGKLTRTIQSARDRGVNVAANLMLCNTVLEHFDKIIDLLARAGLGRITLLRYKPPADQSRWVLENPPPDTWHSFERRLCDTINRHADIAFRVDCALSFLQRGLDSDAAAALGIRGCVAGERILALAPDGGAYPCSQLIRPDLLAGNMIEDDLEDLWVRSTALNGCRAFRDGEQFGRSRCGACDARSHCGGCRVFGEDWRGGDAGCPATVPMEGGL